MGAARKMVIKNDLLNRSRALGNSHRGLKEICSDLLNEYCGGDRKKMKHIAAGTFLSAPTLARISTLQESESGAEYRPHADSLERVLKYFNAEIYFDQVAIKPRYMPQPKD